MTEGAVGSITNPLGGSDRVEGRDAGECWRIVKAG